MTLLRRGELVENDGILHRADAAGISEYRRRWEDEAAEDHIRSAIAGGPSGPADLAALTAKTSPLWDRFPEGRHVESVLEIGAGYGRIPLRAPNFMKYWTQEEVDALLRTSALRRGPARRRSSLPATRCFRNASGRCSCHSHAG